MIDTLVVLEELVRLAVVFVELLGDVRAYVAEFLLDGLGDLQ